jgi:glutamyl-tRNA synthetase
LNPKEEKEVRKIIKKFVLLNALRYNGKATQKPVLSKLLGEHSRFRRKIKEVSPIIAEIVHEINSLTLENQRKIVEEKWPEALTEEKIEETKQLPPLPKVEKYEKVVTRFSPNPDFVLHLGSARAIILSHDYAKIYNGIFILRFEDTDSKTKKPKLEFYEAIRKDLNWLECKWNAEFIQSDRLEIYYKHAEELINISNAYVCTCIQEVFQEKSRASQPCPCRILSVDKNLLRWKRMLDGTYSEGEAVIRIKTDLTHPNPAIRDWPALRIIDPEEYPHPRVGSKYRVWPLYNFSTAVDDHLMNITHIIRGKEHLTNQARQEYMYKYFGWEYPETIHYGRLKITGASLSKSEILKGLADGDYKHWDDPRLATLAALRRRGITPEAIHSLMIDVGPKPADVVLSWKNLYAYNRKQIDPNAKRYFFVKDPVRISIKNIPHAFTAQVPFHPDLPEKGFRYFEIRPSNGEAAFLISKDDIDIVKNEQTVRLMDLFNFRVEKVKKSLIQATFLGESYEEAKKIGAPLIHWLPVNSSVPCEVVMPDASMNEGLAEEACSALKPNDIIQFQRYGFVRVDNVDGRLTAYFAHR